MIRNSFHTGPYLPKSVGPPEEQSCIAGFSLKVIDCTSLQVAYVTVELIPHEERAYFFPSLNLPKLNLIYQNVKPFKRHLKAACTMAKI